MGIFNTNSSKLVRIIFLISAGLCLIASFALVFTSKDSNQTENSKVNSFSTKTNNNAKLLKLSYNQVQSSNDNLDLTILGHRNLKNSSKSFATKNKKHREKVHTAEKAKLAKVVENKEIPIVRISRQGRIQGAVHKSRQNRNYFAFYKVPYAEPPVGKLRFAPPKEPKSWRGTRDGNVKGSQCLQKDKSSIGISVAVGSEDCLHLNIYTPKLPKTLGWNPKSESKLPVLFYIHGGVPYGNGTRYGAKYFMDEDVVLVTINYRLGMLGDFTTGTSEFPGNLDCRDQVQALRWVQQNIYTFGGDPERVLIFGNSLGGAFVHAHILSPMSKGLFNRAIMQSGTSIRVDQLIPKPQEKTREFLDEIECWDSNFNSSINEIPLSKASIECLWDLEGSKIVLSRGQLSVTGFTVEVQEDDWKNKFLPERPWDILAEGKVSNNRVPVIIGVVSKEGYLEDIVNEMLLNGTFLQDNFDQFFSNFTGIPEKDIKTKFRQVYFGGREISIETRHGMWNLMSDLSVHASRMAGLTLTNSTKQSVYFYRFEKDPLHSYDEKSKKLFPPPYGAAHSDELQYLFNYDSFPEIQVDSPEFEFSEELIKIWVSFARDGKPNIQNLQGNKDNIQWKPISKEDNGMKWLVLDDEIKYVHPFTSRMELWDEYIDKFYVSAKSS